MALIAPAAAETWDKSSITVTGECVSVPGRGFVALIGIAEATLGLRRWYPVSVPGRGFVALIVGCRRWYSFGVRVSVPGRGFVALIGEGCSIHPDHGEQYRVSVPGRGFVALIENCNHRRAAARRIGSFSPRAGIRGFDRRPNWWRGSVSFLLKQRVKFQSPGGDSWL